MNKKEHGAPETPATRFLRQQRIAHSTHLYEYEEHGGTTVSARELNVPEHAVVKTLIMQDEKAQPLIVLMHGDHQVSTKELARQSGRKRIEICPRRLPTGIPAIWSAALPHSARKRPCRYSWSAAFSTCH